MGKLPRPAYSKRAKHLAALHAEQSYYADRLADNKTRLVERVREGSLGAKSPELDSHLLAGASDMEQLVRIAREVEALGDPDD